MKSSGASESTRAPASSARLLGLELSVIEGGIEVAEIGPHEIAPHALRRLHPVLTVPLKRVAAAVVGHHSDDAKHLLEYIARPLPEIADSSGVSATESIRAPRGIYSERLSASL
jgi:hypothetical protein